MLGFLSEVRILASVVLMTLCVVPIPPEDQPKVPSANADLGPCYANFKVTDAAGKPLADAEIQARIPYGFWNSRMMNLEVTTNSDGKARVIGLPQEFRKTVGTNSEGKPRIIELPQGYKKKVTFHITYNDMERSMEYDPVDSCQGDYAVVLGKPEPQARQKQSHQ